MKALDSKAVQEIAHANPTSEALFTDLSRRERNRSEIDVERMRQNLVAEGFHIVPEAVVETFEQLARAGVGEIVRGKNGRASRFRFHFGLKEVARASGVVQLAPKVVSKPEALKAPSPYIKVVVILPNDRTATLSIPQDLSDEETETIIKRALIRR